MNRQPFTSILSISLALLIASAAALAETERQVGTIGPPPRQNPQRQTSAEGLPPLPLPAVPLRRSEPKAEPKPPTFVGKLKYGSTQDYMPNPGDVDNLLRHVRHQLDAWYGWRIVDLIEVVQTINNGRDFDLPMLYITGYQAFELRPEEREALREYLISGGTLVGDATLGSPAFTQSFQREIAAMFPNRQLRPLDLDHPVYRGYYKYAPVEYFTVTQGHHTKMQGPPELWGMNLAARTAVIFSPFDMTCGWDEFFAPAPNEKVADAPRTKAMMPKDAIRMGINIVAYTSAQRPFAKTQAVTRKVEGEQRQARVAMPLALLRHQGDWNPDPSSLNQLIRFAATETTIPMSFELRPVDAALDQLLETPVVIITGMDEPKLTEQQVLVLRRHLQAGGFLFINNTSGFARFDREARVLMQQILPDRELEAVAEDDPILSSLYEIKTMQDAAMKQPRPVELYQKTLGDRTVIVYSPNDTLGRIKGIHDPYANAYDQDSARKLALNILAYAMQR